MPPLLIRHCDSRDRDRQTDSETMGNRGSVTQDRQTQRETEQQAGQRSTDLIDTKRGREGEGVTHRHTQKETEGATATDIYKVRQQGGGWQTEKCKERQGQRERTDIHKGRQQQGEQQTYIHKGRQWQRQHTYTKGGRRRE